MAGKYATQTAVPVERTKAEIEAVLRRYGAVSFASGWDQDRAVIQFDCHQRRIRFVLTLPSRDDPAFTHYRRGQYGSVIARTRAAADTHWEQACRSAWRSLLLVIKAMLEAVEAEIVAFETAFAPYMVLPNGSTVAEWLVPQIDSAYEHGTMPSMLSLTSGKD